ncbi:hypothetical protein [uncultured Ruminococcus sp.]|nr:hypothetical protein [uncultured Ruminococcus sp.]
MNRKHETILSCICLILLLFSLLTVCSGCSSEKQTLYSILNFQTT